MDKSTKEYYDYKGIMFNEEDIYRSYEANINSDYVNMYVKNFKSFYTSKLQED